jgi:hypothetical protein
MKIQDFCNMMPGLLASTVAIDGLEELAAFIFWF